MYYLSKMIFPFPSWHHIKEQHQITKDENSANENQPKDQDDDMYKNDDAVKFDTDKDQKIRQMNETTKSKPNHNDTGDHPYK